MYLIMVSHGYFLLDCQNLMMKCAGKLLPASVAVNEYVCASKSALLQTWSTFTEVETKAFYSRVWVIRIIVITSQLKAVGCYIQ